MKTLLSLKGKEEVIARLQEVRPISLRLWGKMEGGTPARLGYYDNYLIDNPSCVIVGVQATAARMSQETVAAQDMLTRFTQWQGREPESVAADTTYGNGEFLQWLADRSITPYMRTRTVSTERTACSSVPSGSRIHPRATAIAVRRGSN
jgi:hypothetical protein